MKEKLKRTCALTGHRDLPEDFDRNALYDKLEELLISGCDCFLCGMALGFDLTALACLVDLKQRYRFTIEACIPYLGQENNFPVAAKKQYRELLQWCDQKTVLFDSYCRGCFLARNRYMVDRADIVIAYCKRDKGGAAYTVDYAMKKRVPVLFLI